MEKEKEEKGERKLGRVLWRVRFTAFAFCPSAKPDAINRYSDGACGC